MRWIFYALFLFNVGLFGFCFSVMRPSSDLRFVEPVPIAGVDGRVTLLSESTLKRNIAQGSDASASREYLSAGSPRVVATQEKNETTPPKCFRIGPFSIRSSADDYQNEIGFSDGLARIEERPISKDSKYWVYIPPAESKNEALATLRTLQVAGIDSFVVLKGRFSHAISLGTFMNADSADALKEQVASLGYTVAVDVQQNVRNEYWLYLQAVESNQQNVIEAQIPAALSLSVFSCEMFAQDKIFP